MKKQFTLTAYFKGQDGSMGFKFGLPYTFKTVIENGLLKVISDNGLYCHYSNLESLLSNWVFQDSKEVDTLINMVESK